MNINIKTIPNSEQRYQTCGDWWFDPEGNIEIRVSKMSDWRYEFLVGLHELVEVALCKYSGVTQQEVDDFDIVFEKNRSEGNTDEPGDDSEAPYRIQHGIATGVERIAAAFLGVDWNKYDLEVATL